MQDYARRNGNPRRLLVGVVRARKFLTFTLYLFFATLLLQWYLKHRMSVSKIYQLVEFTPSSCFREFVTEVTEARRLGVRDPFMSVIANIQKLFWKCAYWGLNISLWTRQNTKKLDIWREQSRSQTNLTISFLKTWRSWMKTSLKSKKPSAK